ncbi:hypothetical protein RESH_02048 [Rhodopirellula europaea SH398]|uniref:Uncharacterized protein n=1 Tax=Rhodopirellula europaea SH398 TaxID=1263868 RepID=M5S793_9BACT|nr:hypothetical protein RESH_02048 [Rhodopirellula europaea SH398]
MVISTDQPMNSVLLCKCNINVESSIEETSRVLRWQTNIKRLGHPRYPVTPSIQNHWNRADRSRSSGG